jgi:Tfp pilus assembly protein PilN
MVAARKDQIESFMRLVDRTGLTPIGLSVSSISLFNYVALLLTPDPILEPIAPKKKKKSKRGKKAKKGAAEAGAEAEPEVEMDLGEGGAEGDDGFVIEEAKALLSIGESNTDLVILRTGKNTNLAFMRSIPIAGREFTRFIQNSVGLESFAEAERIKREATRAFPPEGEPPDDPGIDISAASALSEIIDSKLSRQIQLSLDFFIAQPDGLAVEEIVLCGGSSQIPGIDTVLEERLGIPVTVLDEPMSDVVLLNTTPPSAMANFAVATGEAVSGLGLGRAGINFLPDRYKTRLGFPRVQVAFLTVLLVAMIGLGTQMGDRSTQLRRERAESYQSEIGALTPQQNQITSATETRQQLKTRFEKFTDALDTEKRDYLVRFYADFTAVFRQAAANAFLTELTISPYGDVIIRGRSLDNLAAAGIRQAMLEQMSDYLQPSRSPILVQNNRDANGVYDFEINAYLRHKTSRINTPTPIPRRTPSARAGRP